MLARDSYDTRLGCDMRVSVVALVPRPLAGGAWSCLLQTFSQELSLQEDLARTIVAESQYSDEDDGIVHAFLHIHLTLPAGGEVHIRFYCGFIS